MKFLSKRLSRVLFVEKIFCDSFTGSPDVSIEDFSLLSEMNLESFDKEYLEVLWKAYVSSKETIIGEIERFLKNNDHMLRALVIAGATELTIENKKLVISEYLSISDGFDSRSTVVNSILDKVFSNQDQPKEDLLNEK